MVIKRNAINQRFLRKAGVMEQIRSFDQLLQEMQEAPSRRVAVAAGHDPHTLQAAAMAAERKIAAITLVGNKARIEELCAEFSIDVGLFDIVDERSDMAAGALARDMVAEQRADVLMKGILSTDNYMRLILDKEKGLLPQGAVLSHVTVMEIPEYVRTHNKLLFVTDVAIIPAPDLAAKIKMVKYAVGVAQSFGVAEPKVALLSFSEKVMPKNTSSTDACVIAKMGDRGQLGKCLVDGPLALDVAISKEDCETKGLQSRIEGDADILVFHCLEASNSFYKACTHFGHTLLAGCVVGAKAPCILTSRADSEKAKLCAIALGCRQCR